MLQYNTMTNSVVIWICLWLSLFARNGLACLAWVHITWPDASPELIVVLMAISGHLQIHVDSSVFPWVNAQRTLAKEFEYWRYYEFKIGRKFWTKTDFDSSVKAIKFTNTSSWHNRPIERSMQSLRVVPVLLVDGSANNNLRVVSCFHFHGTFVLRRTS
jgi:hypothetical protein